MQLVVVGMVILLAVYVVKAAYLAFLARRQARFVFAVQVQLSHRLFATYLAQPWLFHTRRNSAQLIRNVINEVNVFAINGLLAVLTLLSEGLVLAFIGALLLMVEPLAALALAALLLIASWGFQRLTRAPTERAGAARQHHEGLRLQHLQQGLAAVREIKLVGSEVEFAERYRVHAVESANAGRWLATLQQLPRLWLELLAVLCIALVVAILAARGTPPGSMLPTLGLFVAAVFRLMPSAQRLIYARQALRYGLPAVDLLHRELALGTGTPTAAARVPVVPLQTCLQVDSVSFTYPGETSRALVDVSLIVRRGEWVAVVGPSGAGKSTLVHIVLGLLAPDLGQVRVDGSDVQDDLRNWHEQIGFVPQSVCLIDDSVARNVAFGMPADRIDENALWHVLDVVKLADFVRALPQGLETPLGERGVRLSGGQIQRIGLARALYRNPTVLVLDEATSSLDSATEREVLRSVRDFGARTVLVVAHRASTVEHCDRRYTLEHGRIVDARTAALA
jgi:ABC-type multidrug transport system fused ATPase/permease subunit